jgi:hypothetical protein
MGFLDYIYKRIKSYYLIHNIYEMSLKKLRTTLIMLIAVISALPLFAQVTTSSITGSVTDNNGEILIGATVIVTHQPTGTVQGTTTREDGRYTLPNLRVGGPYVIEASYVGFETQKFENISLQLAQKFNVDFELSSTAIELGGVVVTAKLDPILNSERTGAETNIGREAIQKLPSISRSAQDYYRLTPSSDGNSFGGRNNKMNNFTLDGSIFNNPFGLDAATPGSQTSAQPVSLDAIEQIQVNIAPYDVTQAGFTGAAVNAVTKSGTNDFKGTVFGFFRNEKMTGSKVAKEDIFVPSLQHMQTGFAIGGPLIKNKLFFFLNMEVERREDLGSNFLANRGTDGAQISRVTATDLEAVSNALFNKYGYETGGYEEFTHRSNNQKGIFKLDWNINSNHTLTATYNFLDALKDKPGHPNAITPRGPNATTLQFKNSGYTINNVLHSGIVELKSIFGNKFSNNLQAGMTSFRDSRSPLSVPFPVMNIFKNGSPYIIAGHEPFSINNRLSQDVTQITNNFNMYLTNHTVTIGASFEKFQFDNSFNLDFYGGTFAPLPGSESVATFIDEINAGTFDDMVTGAQATFDANGGDDGELGKGWALAETNIGQFAVYLQDEWQVNDKFKLTYGVRMDMPLYFDTKTKIEENIDTLRNCCYFPFIEYFDEDGNEVFFDHTVLPKQTPLFSPRFGFNYDLKGDNSMMLRGGSGLFTGRFPFVWVGNQVANPNFYFYTITHPDFKFPQVWRSNLGLDTKIGEAWTASFDVIYTNDIHAMMVRNYGLNKPSGKLSGVDNRPIYTAEDRNSFANDAFVFTNTDIGESFNVSVQLQRSWASGLFTSIAYSYLDSKDASSIPAEISSDAYARNPAFGNVNQAVLAHSLYGNRQRVVGSAYKRYAYGNMATSWAVFFEYAQGGRFSYTYGGDINGDGSPLNDLIYIPTDGEIAQMAFNPADGSVTEQAAALQSYIAQDDYLSENRGEYAGKYDVLSPWYSTWDFRLLQDYNFSVGERTNTIQLSVDVLNIGNLINSKWGVRQFPTNSQPIGVSTVDGNPTYSFDTGLENTFTNDPSLLSRWQLQVGLRYIF